MSTADGIGAVWARPEPGARGPRFTRAQIAATAMAIADREGGLESVSMRRVAAELGAGTMTLYHYVANKQELLDLMNDAMMAGLLVDERELRGGWRKALTAIAHASLRTWREHAWLGSESFGRGGSFGPNSLRHFEQSLAAVADTGLDLDRRMEVVAQVDDYVAGYAQRERAFLEPALGGDWKEKWAHLIAPIAEYLEQQLATGEYPHVEEFVGGDDLVTVMERTLTGKDGTRDRRFERGLNRILDGVAAEIAAR
jgi:AcrR family transcriptional regulator